MTSVLIGVVVMAFFALWVAVFVYWIRAIVEITRMSEAKFRAAGTDRTMWILVVVLGGIIGALVWWFGKREAVLAAPDHLPPPPGWYPAPEGGGLQWWNGATWTADRHQSPSP